MTIISNRPLDLALGDSCVNSLPVAIFGMVRMALVWPRPSSPLRVKGRGLVNWLIGKKTRATTWGCPYIRV